MAAGAVGSMIGGGLGTLVAGPAGTIAGGIAGGAAGAAVGKKRYEKRQAAIRDREWRQSPAGKKALARFDQTMRKLKLDYRQQSDRFKAQKEKIEDELAQARETWLAEKLPQKGVKKKAVAGSLVAGGTMMAVEYATSGKVSGPGATWSALAAVATYPEHIERLKNARWRESPEGQKAGARYIRRMDNLKTRWRRASRQYKAQKAAAKAKYEIAKARALAN
jgi:hypothetical protein